jgi:hypothetical protein
LRDSQGLPDIFFSGKPLHNSFSESYSPKKNQNNRTKAKNTPFFGPKYTYPGLSQLFQRKKILNNAIRSNKPEHSAFYSKFRMISGRSLLQNNCFTVYRVSFICPDSLIGIAFFNVIDWNEGA